MPRDDSLLKQRQELIEQIDQLAAMRKGSVTKQMLPYKRKDGSTTRRGPYFTYTFKEKNKTKGQHLRDEQESACKTVIAKRLKGAGMFWTVRGANAIIALRCCLASGRFEQFWEDTA